MATQHMVTFTTSGNFSKFDSYCQQILEAVKLSDLDKYGQMGVDALAHYTPIDSGLTASSWSYEITRTKKGVTIGFKNSNVTSNGTPVAILLQYGHATRGGGYVEGIDYINPALRPIFNQIAIEAWREVTR
jgi:hypothetical protein